MDQLIGSISGSILKWINFGPHGWTTNGWTDWTDSWTVANRSEKRDKNILTKKSQVTCYEHGDL